MEYRKLISFGSSSYVVSLPKHWLNKNNLGKGDTVFLDVNGKEIVLSPKDEKAKKEIEVIINADGLSADVIEKKLVSAYINNADSIKVKTKDLPQKVKRIKETTRTLIAMETVEEDSEKIVLKSFLKIEDVDISSFLRKTDHLITSMFQDLDEIANSDRFEAVEISDNIEQRDIDVNKMCFLIFRAINHGIISRHSHYTNSLQLWALVFFLEQIGDTIKRVGRLMANLENKKALLDIINIIKQARSDYKDAMKAFFTHNKELVYEVGERRKILMESCMEIQEKYSNNPQMSRIIDKTKNLVARIHTINRMSY